MQANTDATMHLPSCFQTTTTMNTLHACMDLFVSICSRKCLRLHAFCLCRLLAKDDVFAIPCISTGDMEGILQSLYSMPDGPLPLTDLMYFKVTCLEPSCGTSCAIDFQKTNLMLEVNHSQSCGVIKLLGN